MKRIISKIRNFIATVRAHHSMPLRLEFVVSDYCNLNCKGCTHYSPLAPDEFESIATLERSAAHLGATVGHDIGDVYIIGGEPLLYPHLTDAMEMMRRHFPDNSIKLFTNGLLLPRMNDEFWLAAKRHRIIIALTIYPIKFDYDAAQALCARHGIECMIFGDRRAENSFMRFGLDPTKKQNARLSHFKCFNRGCISVIDDKIYPCSISGCVSHLNKACGTSFEHQPGDWLNVADVKTAKQIKALRDNPVPFCRYCNPNPTVTDYGHSRRDKHEWTD
ncbi:MAG: radical SAM protein [Muribaculaceae bacterium]|nr:radical SAM protein [Muribaculaceae bacterium]